MYATDIYPMVESKAPQSQHQQQDDLAVRVESKSVVDEEAEADLAEAVVQKIQEDRENQQKEAKVDEQMVIEAAIAEVDKKPAVPDPFAALKSIFKL